MTRTPTPRELRTLAACLRAGSQKAAAHELGIPLQTAKNRLGSLYAKLGVDCYSQAAIALGWLSLPEDESGTSDRVAANG